MSSTNRYLEFNSSYRDRNLWPLPAQFEIPISQTGRKGQQDALDPVCVSSPYPIAWTCNNFDCSGNNLINVTIFTGATIGSTSNGTLLIIKSAGPNQLQQVKDYYSYTVISGGGIDTRILEYIFLYTDGFNDYAQISILGVPPAGACTIEDPSTIITGGAGVTPSILLFVPAGRLQRNGYCTDIIYNETLMEYKKIYQYDNSTRILIADTLNETVATNWLLTHNYSLRKEPPSFLNPSSTYPSLITPITYNGITYTGNERTLILQSPSFPESSPENTYKNWGIRVIPNPTAIRYNYLRTPLYTNLTPPYDEERIITYSIGFTIGVLSYIVIILNKPLSVNPYSLPPGIDIAIEILKFSYDNFNPFIYSGSLVSQQDLVCYEVELVNLIVPNNILNMANGGLAAFYPYLYVELSNVSSPNGHLRNLIYSNVPTASKATFRVPIDDIPSPLISTFLKIDGDGMVQIIKFKPNDNLYISIYLYTGEVFNTILPEFYSPSPPNPMCQISCLFNIRRI